jgi:hypothetical protein
MGHDTKGFETVAELPVGESLPSSPQDTSVSVSAALSSETGEANPYSTDAGRYADLSTGTWLEWSFETQTSVPVDGADNSFRKYSPFILRLIPPHQLIPNQDGSEDVNLIGRGGQSFTSFVSGSRSGTSGGTLLAASYTDNNSMESLSALQQTVAAGKIITSVTNNTTEQISTLVDIYTLADIQMQMLAMAQAPPLALFINPQDFSVSYSSIQEYSNRSRDGYIFQRWGEGQPTISISGSTGSFLTSCPPGTFPPASSTSKTLAGSLNQTNQENWSAGGPTSVSGVQFASRRGSAAYQNFQSLFLFYRNNGYLYDNVGGSCAHLGVGGVAIDYDQKTYVGHIESFSYSFQEGSPHRIQWTMEFIVDIEYDHATSPSFVGPMGGTTTPTVNEGIQSARQRSSSVVAQADREGGAGTGPGVRDPRSKPGFGGGPSSESSVTGPAGVEPAGWGTQPSLVSGVVTGPPSDTENFDSGGGSTPFTARATGRMPFELIGSES